MECIRSCESRAYRAFRQRFASHKNLSWFVAIMTEAQFIAGDPQEWQTAIETATTLHEFENIDQKGRKLSCPYRFNFISSGKFSCSICRPQPRKKS